MSLAAPVPVSDASTTLLLKFSKTTLFLTVVLSTTSVTQLKERALAVLVESGQPQDAHLPRPFGETRAEDVQVYVGETSDDATRYIPLQDTRTVAPGMQTEDGSPHLDAFELQDGQVLYLGFPGTPHVQLPSFDDEEVEQL